MGISLEQVRYVAALSRIELSPEEEEKFTHQLGDILTYVEKLNECDIGGVQPISQASLSVNVFRDDELKASLPQEEALDNAPERGKGFFKVPKIIE